MKQKSLNEFLNEKPAIKIIPDNIDNSLVTDIVNFDDKHITCSVSKGNVESYSVDNKIEIFFLSDDGYVYFNSVVTAVDAASITFTYPPEFIVLQRREFERINFYKKVEISNEISSLEVDLLNLSSGGVRFLSNISIQPRSFYNISFDVDKNLSISCKIEIIDVKNIDENSFCLRGKFIDIDDFDVVKLSQFCQKTIIEEMNK